MLVPTVTYIQYGNNEGFGSGDGRADHLPSLVEYLQVQQSQVVHTTAKSSRYWIPPKPQKLKINVDGAFLPSKNIGGIGGVIRRDNGAFVAGFSHSLQFVSSPKQVESLAIRSGVDLLRQLRLQEVCIESDCQVAIQEVGADDFELSENANILADIRNSSKHVKDLSFMFTPRTANMVAHRLAAFAYESNANQANCLLLVHCANQRQLPILDE
ncbi:uncharacterized protein LOC133734664 [Rosa rugosa]|uniref:uncharacterized protein LOC133734664 n=1 Tax=Rosa rugosa TaxID=74645 RepID=UPI002B4181B0|nr:uncharacterized protein LOC133734664 [Rosa rugosa]